MTSSPSARHDLRGVRRAYDTVAADYAAHLPDTRCEASLDLAMVDAFATVVTAGAGGPVLDAGCGAGRMSRYLADRGCAVAGVDLSPGMVAMAVRDHPDLVFTVGSLAELPFPDGRFAGVMLWYSIIHTPPAGQPRIFAEAARVLRPGGHLLVGWQAGHGTWDVAPAYRRFGHEIALTRHRYTADDVCARVDAAGLREVCRLVRRPTGGERDDQAFLLAVAG
ncbi:class I SAM-dependent methyltransferase [Micromonospora sp. DT31]|uniref:class I SAM-dependent methyltransferase n=1 Tax=Micromonospora sp. DT31 TaxID=3393434 RepID=UPI003CF5E945